MFGLIFFGILFMIVFYVFYQITKLPNTILDMALFDSNEKSIEKLINSSSNSSFFNSNLKTVPIFKNNSYSIKQVYYDYNKYNNIITLDNNYPKKTYNLSVLSDLDEVIPLLIFKQ